MIRQIKLGEADENTTYRLDLPEYAVAGEVVPFVYDGIKVWIEVGFHSEDKYYQKPGPIRGLVRRNLPAEALRNVDWVRSDAGEI